MFDATLWRWVPLAATLLLSGCSTLDYYSHLTGGHLHLLQTREPIAELLENPATDPELKQRLALAQQARDFASAQLSLPNNGSYRVYADIQRPFVVWNVFATPEFSLSPELHCFPIAGCVAYRGFYSLGRARGSAALLKQQGLDTYLGGVEAYSTLGWFDDPILNTMLRWSDERLVAVIFHELAHQQLYVADDTAFNESFASFVEREGLRQWRAEQGLQPNDPQGEQQREQFIGLVLASRARLQQLYASDLPPAQMRSGKHAELARLRAEYHALSKREWAGSGRYDDWINAPINNAKLLPFGLYDQWVPAFAALFEQVERDWSRFYERVAALGELPVVERQQALTDLSPGS
ncbi:aminopeptidase [Pseudomonas sp. EA_35y_Pfl2_R5]|uniref:aminopeptidase n=1 Tax=Pseudomonas sp. EA_35y_Pfl2_R5 TaxID=3088690 RepID=UPI0030D893DF